jgi:hypothetical protein
MSLEELHGVNSQEGHGHKDQESVEQEEKEMTRSPS